MASIHDEIKYVKEYLGTDNPTAKEMYKEALKHYGMPRRSGRYPWGSGKDKYQRNADFRGRVQEYRKQGMSDTEIAKTFGITTTELRAKIGLARSENRTIEVAYAKALKEDGLGPTEIGRKMSERFGRKINESSVRSYLDPAAEVRTNRAINTADKLRSAIEKKGMIDVGKGIPKELGVSQETFNQALKILEKEGYPVYGGRIKNVTNPTHMITQKVICPKGTEHKEIYNLEKIHNLKEYTSKDGGITFETFKYPTSLSSKRVKVRFDEDGGTLKDGIVELRPGVKDLSLGNNHYAQVRILVDGNKYIKGVAVYGKEKDFPKGVDVIVNSNKKRKIGKLGALKDIEDDPDNPFGAYIKEAGGQSYYDDPKGKYKDPITGKKQSLSKINKTREEGDWSDWQDKLPSQFLSKQPVYMAKKQLGLAMRNKDAEYEEILSLPNKTVMKNRLRSFADDCDSAALNLYAAALPGQKYHVIIPNNTLKDTECYCPRYETGTKLALVRYPHGGTFEIPIVTVNNKNKLGKELIGNTSTDAICINHKVAARLSGADFDGDTVMCLPTHDRKGKVKIVNSPELPGLKNFEPKDEYAIPKGNPHNRPLMKKGSIQLEMGGISNLISDMTLLGAKNSELEAAVKHSMVVIDAYKHKLDYKQSEMDNNIKALKKEYQGATNAGASTLISKASGQYTVPRRQGSPRVNIKGKYLYDPSKPEGSLVYKTSDNLYYPKQKYNKKTGLYEVQLNERGKKITYDPKNKKEVEKYAPVKRVDKNGNVTFTNKKGDIIYKTEWQKQKSKWMTEVTDAKELISDANTVIERTYASYANYMKGLANKSRLKAENIGSIAYNKTARKKYDEEYKSLNKQLNEALSNSPKERQAHRLANVEVKAKIKSNPALEGDKEKIRKLSQQALTKYRAKLGAKRHEVFITDKEWEAIQAHAIPESMLSKILDKANNDRLNELCMPRNKRQMTTAKLAKAKAMASSNYSIQEIANALGLSISTVSQALKGGK